jgi:tetratricopeptide (TPR) repeat protein
MAEGLLGGILGDDKEKPEVEAPEALASAEAFASSVAARLSASDPEVARETSSFLRDQSHLLKVQAKHLEDEHALRIAHLRNQLREESVRRFGLRLRVGFQLFIALVATVIGVGGAIILHDAVTSRQVVVDAFEAPPALATRGVSGTVVAGALLDELTRMREATRTNSVSKRDVTSAWSHEVKVSLPDAGISLTELSRLLRERLGHDIHIGGALLQTNSGGLALTVRGDGVAARTFTGSSDELDTLSVKAAQYVYAESQPVQWAIYLENEFRYENEVAFIKSVYARVGPDDRPYLLNAWGNAESDIIGNAPEVLAMYRTALKLKPDYWVAYFNVIWALTEVGKEEDAWQASQQFMQKTLKVPEVAPLYSNSHLLVWDLQAALATEQSDADTNAGLGTSDTSLGPFAAVTQSLLHDTAAAELTLQTLKIDTRDIAGPVMIHFARGLLAIEANDTAKAASEMDAAYASIGNPLVDGNIPARLRCWVALAEEAARRTDKADAVLKTAGTFVDCYRFRGDILDGRGDWAGAQKAYADAVMLAPDLPAAYFSWGTALARHDDLAGAEAKLREANRRGPHWADPLKAWGDVLLKQGKTRDALAKYDEALKYAPNWKQLKEAREATAKKRS